MTLKRFHLFIIEAVGRVTNKAKYVPKVINMTIANMIENFLDGCFPNEKLIAYTIMTASRLKLTKTMEAIFAISLYCMANCQKYCY